MRYVTNESLYKPSYEEVTVNLLSSIRREKMGGVEYLVAPASLIVPGVLNGSAGPLYYPAEEISKNVAAWNMMPLTLGHPTDESGSALSARSPKVLEKFALGFVFNAKTTNGKLEAEAWFDVVRTQSLAPQILTNLEAGNPIELSTGLFMDHQPVKNKYYKGRPYHAIARNYRPDHLAILPNAKGACSLEDGCGVLNENKKSNSSSVEKFNRCRIFKPKCPFGCNNG